MKCGTPRYNPTRGEWYECSAEVEQGVCSDCARLIRFRQKKQREREKWEADMRAKFGDGRANNEKGI